MSTTGSPGQVAKRPRIRLKPGRKAARPAPRKPGRPATAVVTPVPAKAPAPKTSTPRPARKRRASSKLTRQGIRPKGLGIRRLPQPTPAAIAALGDAIPWVDCLLPRRHRSSAAAAALAHHLRLMPHLAFDEGLSIPISYLSGSIGNRALCGTTLAQARGWDALTERADLYAAVKRFVGRTCVERARSIGSPTHAASLPRSRTQREQVRSRHAEVAREHIDALAALRPAEERFVRDQLVELPEGRHHGVDQVAVLVLAGRPLLPFAEDLFAGCVATAAGWRSGGAMAEMRWLRRLAPVDWEETTEAIGRAAAAFPVADASPTFHWAVQHALYDGGHPAQAVLADETWPLLHDGPRVSERHGLEGLCDVEPLDPGVEGPGIGLGHPQGAISGLVRSRRRRPSTRHDAHGRHGLRAGEGGPVPVRT